MDLVLTRFRSGYDWIWANDSLMDAIEALKDYQEAQPDDDIDVKIAAAKKAYEDALDKARIGWVKKLLDGICVAGHGGCGGLLGEKVDDKYIL